MAIDPEMSFVMNHAAELGPATHAVVLLEMRIDGSIKYTRFSKTKNTGDYITLYFYLQRFLNQMLDVKTPNLPIDVMPPKPPGGP